MKISNESGLQCNLTFFEPPKEENAFSQSGLFQSVIGFFNSKKSQTSNISKDSSPESNSSTQLDHDNLVLHYKVEQLPNNSELPSSSRTNLTQKNFKDYFKNRAFSTHSLNDEVLSRPSELNVSPVYNTKDQAHGSEVELRLKNFSTLFKEIPKKISKNNQPYLKDFGVLGSSRLEKNDIKQYWMPDNQCYECYECNERFTTFRRRHHCRICGHVFCSRCCYQLVSGAIIGCPGMVRSCTYCYNLVLSHDRNTDRVDGSQVIVPKTEHGSASESQYEHGASLFFSDVVNHSFDKPEKRMSRTRSMISMSKFSPIKSETYPVPLKPSHETSSAFDVFDAAALTSPHSLPSSYQNEQINLAKNSLQLHNLWIRMTDPEIGLQFKDRRFRLRKLSDTLTGVELTEWLQTHEISSSRDQAFIIGQALVDAEFLENVIDVKDKAFQEEYFYQPGKKSVEYYKINRDTEPDFDSGNVARSVRTSLDQSALSSVDGDNEPNWVREITEEGEYQISDDGGGGDEMEEESSRSGGTFFSTPKPFINESAIHFSDEESNSPISTVSLSSYVEIDNQRSVIKYKRQSNLDDAKSRNRDHSDIKQPRFVGGSLTEINADYIRGYLSWHGAYLNNLNLNPSVGWRDSDVYSPSVASTAKQTFCKLQKMYFDHSMRFLKQLFDSNELEQTWNDLIVQFSSKICDSIVPDFDVSIDVVHYVHVKKLLDGPPSDSRLINGVVFTSNVINSKMKTRIDNPVIMLLGTPLEYQRVHKLASLDPVVRQEEEFFKNLTNRIKRRDPDIVISQCGVAHIAKKLLHDAGITLIINVKEPVMKRLARATGADVASSIDRLKVARLGTCTRFRVIKHFNGKRSIRCSDGPNTSPQLESKDESFKSFKTMIYLDGCISMAGCSVLLRNAPNYDRGETDADALSTLSRVKSVFLQMVRIYYHCKLELSYLMDQHDFSSVSLLNCTKPRSRTDPTNSGRASLDMTEQILEDSIERLKIRHRTDTLTSQQSDTRTVTSDIINDEEVIGENLLEQRPSLLSSISMPADTSFSLNSVDESEQPECDIHSCFYSTILSYSPLTPNKLPFLLTERGKSTSLSPYLPPLLYWSDKFPDAHLSSELNTNKTQHFSSTTDHSHPPDGTASKSSDVKLEGLWESSSMNHFDEPKSDEKHDFILESTESSQSSSKPHSLTTNPSSSQSDFPSLSNPKLNEISNKTSYSQVHVEHESKVKEADQRLENVHWLPTKHPFLSSSFGNPSNSKNTQDMLADFRANGSSLQFIEPRFAPPLRSLPGLKRYAKKKKANPNASKPYDCLSLANHQHICVLFSSYSSQSPNPPYPCVMPWTIKMNFYKGNDVTFGGFLDRYCFRSCYSCPNRSCESAMVEHIRCFAHGKTCMNIILKELSNPVKSSEILTWSWNPESKSSTNLKTLSQDAKAMSFAKFLHFRLSTFSLSRDDVCNPENELEIPPFESYQYFLYKDIVAAFKCFEINVFDIALPPLTVEFHGRTSWMKFDELSPDSCPQYSFFVSKMNFLSRVGYERMDAILDMIKTTRSNTPFEQNISEQSEWNEDVSSLKSKRESYFEHLLSVYQEEKCHLRDSIDNIHLKLQALRINCEHEENDDKNEPFIEEWSVISEKEVDHQSNSSQASIDKQNEPPVIVKMDAAIVEQLSLMLLELKSLICKLIHTWNSRIATVFDQDKLSRKGHRSSSNDRYVDHTMPLETSLSNKEGRLKISPFIDTVFESNLPVESNEVDVNIKQQTHENQETKESPIGSIKEETIESMKSQTTEETSPIPIPNRAVERASITATGAKKYSRAASAKNVKSLVSQFLYNPIQTQVNIPFPINEHYLLPHCSSSGILVRDDEPSSIIAYALKSPEYQLYIEVSDPTSVLLSSDNNSISSEIKDDLHNLNNDDVVEKKEEEEEDLPKVAFKGSSKSSASKFSLSVSKPSSLSGSSPIPSPPLSPSQNSPHIEVQFKDSTTKFYCKVFFAARFKALRRQVCGDKEDDYIASLSRCVRWAARGGKSGSAFHKSLDDRFVLKQMSRFEMQSFLEVAHDYLDYVNNAMQNKQPTALSKILGVYRVSFRNTPSGRSFKQDILVMENLFYKRNIQQVFDLKGSVRNRHVKESSSSSAPSSLDSNSTADVLNKNDLVLLDENLLSIMRDRPLYVHEHSKAIIKRALSEDAKFLSSHLIIDYSLLVGVDADRQEIVVGIIDYLRTFTWDKKLEMVVKYYGMIGRHGSRSMPTVVSPELYRNRFCEAMDRYFLAVPDKWYGMQAYRDVKH